MKKFLLTLTAIFMCIGAHAKTETINWYMDGNTYATTQCETGSDIILPQTPYKYGYTFNGWFGYTPIEYLESTGTQWIDTGVICGGSIRVFKTETRIAWTAKKTLLNANPFFIGAFDQDNNIKKFLRTGLINNNFAYTVSPSTESYDNTSTETPTLNVIYDTTFTYGKGDKASLVVNQGDTNIVNSSETGDWLLPNSSAFLFGYNNINDDYRLALCRIYACKIYLDDVLVRDFIPVLDPDGVPCMFDKVEQKFYYNAGTGQFVAGPVIGE